ncbi:MAG: hypothetical protein QW177_09805 [Candidatus Nitrosotenuis sp.]
MEVNYVSLAALLISLSAVGLSVIKFTRDQSQNPGRHGNHP